MKYKIQKAPFIVPTHDGKLIEEHFGLASIPTELSIARMVAPPDWSEPFQTPDFDEYTIIITGKKQFTIDGETIVLEAGESILIYKGTRVRYANPFEEPVVYISVCLPAFSVDKVHRES